MLTTLLLARLWQNAQYRRLMRELLSARPEADLGLEQRVGGPLAAAALAVLRLGELNQADLAITRQLRQRLLLSQCADGSWGEAGEKPLITALCIRGLAALAGGSGLAPPGSPGVGMLRFGADQPLAASQASAIRKGIEYLARSQSGDGGWGGEALVTAVVLLELGRMPLFRDSIRVADALEHASGGLSARSPECRRAWARLQVRCGRTLRQAALEQQHATRRRRQPLFAKVA